MKIRTAAMGLAVALALGGPAAAWEREAYGCAAGKLDCPLHLSADEVQLILGFVTEAEAVAHYDATYAAVPAATIPVMAGIYRPVAAEYQSIVPASCAVVGRDPSNLGSEFTVQAGRGILTWGQGVMFPQIVSESEFLLIFGLCGPANPNGKRSLTDWVGPGAHFWSDEPPEGVAEWAGYWVVSPDGRIARAVAGDHAVIPLSAGGRSESWLVTHYELIPGTGARVEIGFGEAAAGGLPPPPPAYLPPAQMVEQLWQAGDPCAALRRIAAGLDMVGQGALLQVRARDGDGPQACAELYTDLLRRLRGEPRPPRDRALPVFLWTLP